MHKIKNTKNSEKSIILGKKIFKISFGNDSWLAVGFLEKIWPKKVAEPLKIAKSILEAQTIWGLPFGQGGGSTTLFGQTMSDRNEPKPFGSGRRPSFGQRGGSASPFG